MAFCECDVRVLIGLTLSSVDGMDENIDTSIKKSMEVSMT